MPYKDPVQQKEAQQRNYLSNKQRYADCRKKNKDKRRIWFQNLKSEMRCLNCGQQDMRCLDFHHRNPSEKNFGICEGVKNAYSELKILHEISKCDVLCANCHMRQHPRKGYLHRKRVEKNAEWLRDYKNGLYCIECNIRDDTILVFHHRDVIHKKDTICHMISNGCSVTTLLDEISKCDVLCGNCHRIKHNGNVWDN